MKEFSSYMQPKQKNLAVICSLNPTESLLRVIQKLNKFYSDFDIAVIDSDSDKLDTYEIVKKEYPDVKIHLVENKNYEFGALNEAYKLHPNYSTYMLTQDNITPINRLPMKNMDKKDVFFMPHDSGFQSDGEMVVKFAEEVLGGTKYFNSYLQLKNSRFPICSCNFFIAKNSIVKSLLNNLRVLPRDKIGSCSYERILAIFFLEEKCNMIRLDWTSELEYIELDKQRKENPDMVLYFHKEYFGRV